MQIEDTQEFFTVWDQCAAIYRIPPAESGPKKMIFKMLAPYSLAEIKQALQRHMTDPSQGQYPPKPADVVRQIQRHATNQFPGAEQAWAQFPRDESLSACICDEMATAWGVACEQDEISGRMTFKEAYNREVAKSQASGRKPRWFISVGADKDLRAQVVLDAVRDRLISPLAAQAHLPHIPVDELHQLSNSETTASQLLENHAQTVSSVTALLESPQEPPVSREEGKRQAELLRQVLNGSTPEKPEATQKAAL